MLDFQSDNPGKVDEGHGFQAFVTPKSALLDGNLLGGVTPMINKPRWEKALKEEEDLEKDAGKWAEDIFPKISQ